mgnify:CR=1 FL=1
MDDSIKRILIIISICLIYILTLVGFFLNPSQDIAFSLIRLCALLGFVSMAVAVIMTPFAVQLYQLFGKTFVKLHHLFALLGLILITLHPVILAIRVFNILVFVPVFDEWFAFWALAGRPALILIYIGVAAGFLRNQLKNSWKKIHALLYIALFFGLIHGTLIGDSFQNPLIIVLFYVLFIAVVLAFAYKRYQIKKRQKKYTKKETSQ